MHLRDYISHYWLVRNNADDAYAIQPDGSVDIVIVVNGFSMQSLVYGSTTAITDIPLESESHYLGISFKPGKSRHFINACASELTDTQETAEGLLKFDMCGTHECIESDEVFKKLDAILERHVRNYQPVHSKLDEIIRSIELSSGMSSVAEAAALSAKSLRQFERVFMQTVGISAKLYSQIVRFRRASALVRTGQPLSRIAADLGYTDQSHMTREFRRFANISPAAFARNDVVFLQDPFFNLAEYSS